MRVYNKLVRDKIPEVIKVNEGKRANTRILDDEEYLKELNIKLKEEVNEYLESGEVEELCDIEEVLRALVALKGVTYQEFDKLRLSKVEKKGAFKDKIFLESVE